MANNKLSEGVGKKIVEALKKQSEIEVNPAPSETKTDEVVNPFGEENFDAFAIEEDTTENFYETSDSEPDLEDLATAAEPNVFEQASDPISIEEPTFAQQPSGQQFMGYQQPSPAIPDNFASELDSFEIPSNIAVLKKLITQLPSGVTRHTGAQIIRQTMEALGISMKSVLQEAQQVQEGLNTSAKECQTTIQEYKKQIINLEKQAQSHQRQYAALNELISLFIQTGR